MIFFLRVEGALRLLLAIFRVLFLNNSYRYLRSSLTSFASNNTSRGMGPKCTNTAIAKHVTIVWLDKSNDGG